MSAWRRVALERFPERAAEVRASYSAFDWLRALEADLRAVYRGEREEPALAGRVFDYVAWCFAPDQNRELRNVAAVGFYEHLGDAPAGRRDLAERLAFEALVELGGLFHQMLPPVAYEALQAEVERVHGRRIPEPVAPAT